MCCLYGFLHYGSNEIRGLKEITNALSKEAAERGTDAAGIAYNDNDRLHIFKEAKSAENIEFKHSDKIIALTGHTRHSTQGSEKRNYNNHPFSGKCKNVKFALAHNGVLMNDKELRKKYHLPKTKVETDIFDELKNGNFEEVPVHCGDILNILPDGNIVYSKFDYKGYCGYGFKDWWNYGTYSDDTNSYIDDLKAVAAFEGICPDEIDYLAENGFTPEEIEEYIYCM